MNADEYNEYRKRYRKKNRERIRRYQADYRKINRKKIRESFRNWWKNNTDKVNAYYQKRRPYFSLRHIIKCFGSEKIYLDALNKYEGECAFACSK